MHKQKGMTFIGLVLVIAGIVFVAIIAMKLVPAYIEFFTVKKTLLALKTNGSLKSMGVTEIQKSFDKTTAVDDIKSVNGRDLDIAKDDAGNTTVAVEYQVVVPLVGNVSALLDFKASTEAEAGDQKNE